MVPPGLEGDVEPLIQGGNAAVWKTYNQVKYYTNVFIIQDGKILLGRKKRGFGIDKYNGFGGKVEPGETSIAAAARELEEEAGIKASLNHAGVFLFLTENIDWAFHIDIYRADRFEGDICETDEMEPAWFRFGDTHASDSLPPIPYEQMWGADRFWLPLVIQNQHFIGRSDFCLDSKTGRAVPCKWWFGVVS